MFTNVAKTDMILRFGKCRKMEQWQVISRPSDIPTEGLQVQKCFLIKVRNRGFCVPINSICTAYICARIKKDLKRHAMLCLFS